MSASSTLPCEALRFPRQYGTHGDSGSFVAAAVRSVSALSNSPFVHKTSIFEVKAGVYRGFTSRAAVKSAMDSSRRFCFLSDARPRADSVIPILDRFRSLSQCQPLPFPFHLSSTSPRRGEVLRQCPLDSVATLPNSRRSPIKSRFARHKFPRPTRAYELFGSNSNALSKSAWAFARSPFIRYASPRAAKTLASRIKKQVRRIIGNGSPVLLLLLPYMQLVQVCLCIIWI